VQIHIIGSGTPDAKKNRSGSAYVLEIGEEMILVDCGPGTTYKMGCMELDHSKVQHLFLTHHHFDHNVDLANFALVWWDQMGAPPAPLSIYGPPPTEAFVDKLLGSDGAFSDDWKARVDLPASQILHQQRGGALPRPAPMDAMVVKDISPGFTMQTERWAVTALWCHHAEPTLDSLMYRFDTAEGSVLFTGDAGACPELTDACREVDHIVICCAYPGEIHPDIGHVVTGAPAVVEIASQSKAKTMILGHQNAAVTSPKGREETLAKIGAAFGGTVTFGDELTTHTL